MEQTWETTHGCAGCFCHLRYHFLGTALTDEVAKRPRICVSVISRYFAGLKDAAMPLVLCVQLPEHKLMFSRAQRTRKQAHAGLSIPLI